MLFLVQRNEFKQGVLCWFVKSVSFKRRTLLTPDDHRPVVLLRQKEPVVLGYADVVIGEEDKPAASSVNIIKNVMF